MISTGSQIRAARALLGWTRVDLAEAACLHENAVAYWERNPVIPTRREPHAVNRIREALRAHGVATFTENGAGVYLMPKRQRRRRSSVKHPTPREASPQQTES